jgi:hypothetical protein
MEAGEEKMLAVTNKIQFSAGDPHVQLGERPRLADLPEGRFGRLFPYERDRYGADVGLELMSRVRILSREGTPRSPDYFNRTPAPKVT